MFTSFRCGCFLCLWICGDCVLVLYTYTRIRNTHSCTHVHKPQDLCVRLEHHTSHITHHVSHAHTHTHTYTCSTGLVRLDHTHRTHIRTYMHTVAQTHTYTLKPQDWCVWITHIGTRTHTHTRTHLNHRTSASGSHTHTHTRLNHRTSASGSRPGSRRLASRAGSAGSSSTGYPTPPRSAAGGRRVDKSTVEVCIYNCILMYVCVCVFVYTHVLVTSVY